MPQQTTASSTDQTLPTCHFDDETFECNNCWDGAIGVHTPTCDGDLCALNGDEHSCTGHFEPCWCCGGTGRHTAEE